MNLKNLCSFILVLFSVQVMAQDKEANIVMFLDFNNNKKELEVARRMAKVKGEELLIVPLSSQNMNSEAVEKQVEGLLKSNKIKSLVLSGHNGGDSYSGTQGTVSVPGILRVLEESSSKESVKSLYLLGCNTANKSKIFFWKSALPNLKFIAGYDGSAPLGHFPNGLGYYEDALKKEKAIIQSSDKAKMKSLIESLKFTNTFEASVYACGPDNNEYLFLSGRKGAERFGALDSAECSQKIKDFQKTYLKELTSYWSGEKEPTTLSPSSGIIKEAYVFMRQNEHCISGENQDGVLAQFNGDNLLFLRFNKEFNHNFINYYRPVLEQAKKEMDELAENASLFIDKMNNDLLAQKEQIKKLQSNPAKMKALINDEIEVLDRKISDYKKQHPGVARCFEVHSTTCLSFKREMEELWTLQLTKDELKTSSRVSEKIDDLLNEKSLEKEHIQYYTMAKEAKNMSEKIQSFLDQPDKVTRKDLMALFHNIQPMNRFYKPHLALKSLLYNYEEMSGNKFPFSWHEVDEKRPVESPLDPSLEVKAIGSQNIIEAKNPEMQTLMNMMSSPY